MLQIFKQIKDFFSLTSKVITDLKKLWSQLEAIYREYRRKGFKDRIGHRLSERNDLKKNRSKRGYGMNEKELHVTSE